MTDKQRRILAIEERARDLQRRIDDLNLRAIRANQQQLWPWADFPSVFGKVFGDEGGATYQFLGCNAVPLAGFPVLILDSFGRTVVSTTLDARGSVTFNPSAGITYYATVSVPGLNATHILLTGQASPIQLGVQSPSGLTTGGYVCMTPANGINDKCVLPFNTVCQVTDYSGSVTLTAVTGGASGTSPGGIQYSFPGGNIAGALAVVTIVGTISGVLTADTCASSGRVLTWDFTAANNASGVFGAHSVIVTSTGP